MSKEKEKYRVKRNQWFSPYQLSKASFCLVLILFLFSCCCCGCGGGGGSEKEGTSMISGFIEGGAVREGVTVTLSGDRDLQTMTGANGYYLFILPAGNYTLTASVADYQPIPQRRTIVVSGNDSSNNNFLLVKDLGASALWSSAVEGEILSSPAIDQDGTVYVGSDDSSLYAFQSTGDLKWSYPTGGAIQSSPAIDQRGTIYVGSNDHRLYALTPDGKLKWMYETGGAIQSSPAIDELGRIYVGSSDNSIYAFSPAGDLRWSYKTEGEIHSSPAIDANGVVYVGSNDKNLYALSSDGGLKWKFPTLGAITASCAIGADGTLYIGSCDHTFYAITAQGNEIWSLATGGEIHSSCALGADDTLYFGSDDHHLYALSADGVLKWTWQSSSAIRSSPAIDQGNIIYFGCDDGTLYALSSQGQGQGQGQGAVYGAFRTDGGIHSSPCLTACLAGSGETQGRIYIGSRDRKLYALANSNQGAADSLWPLFRKGDRHRGAVPLNLLCSISGRVSGVVSGKVTVSLSKMDTGPAITTELTMPLTRNELELRVASCEFVQCPEENLGVGEAFNPQLATRNPQRSLTRNPQPAITTETSPDGAFTFTDIRSGIYILSAQRQGYCFTPKTIEVTASSARNDGNNFTSYPALLLSGKIIGAVQTLRGISVRALSKTWGTLIDTTVTDENGQFCFSLPTGTYILTPALDGYTFSPNTMTVALTQDSEVAFVSLLRTCIISGSINGSFCAGVVLYLDGNNSEGSTIRGMTNTKANGRFEFTVHRGSYTISPYLEGYFFTPASRQVVVRNASSYGGNDFTAYAQGHSYLLSGTVSGDIRENVTLTLSGDVSATTLSNSRGEFSFQLSNGHYFLSASKANYSFSPSQREITLQGADGPNNDFSAVHLPYSITGKIFGDVVKGINVTLIPQTSAGVGTDLKSVPTPAEKMILAEALTDGQGNFSFSASDGSYTLTPVKSGFRFEPVFLGITIHGAPVSGLQFTSMKVEVEGVQKWAVKTGGSIYSSPALDSNGAICVGSYDDGQIYAISPDGDIRWKFATQSHIFASPMVDPKSGTMYIGGTDNCVYAIGPQGGEKWKTALPDSILATAAIGADGNLYIGCSDGCLYALDPDNGQKKWASKLENAVSSPAVGTDGTIYVGSGQIDWLNLQQSTGSFYALSPGDGRIKWKKEMCIFSRPAVGPDGMIYVGSKEGYIYALDTRVSGAAIVKWEYRLGGPAISSPALGPDGTIYVGCDDGRLYALNPNGSLRWTAATGGKIRSSAAVGPDGAVYVGSNDYYLYAFNSTNGDRKWRFLTDGGSITATPVIGQDGTIYVASQNGTVYAIHGE